MASVPSVNLFIFITPKGSTYNKNIGLLINIVNYKERDRRCTIEFTNDCHIQPRIFLFISNVTLHLLAVAIYRPYVSNEFSVFYEA
jgi:hypothetical protein